MNTAFPVITGRAFPGNTVDVCIEGIMCVRTIADASGNFGVQFQAPLADGRYAVTAVQSDGICGVSCVAHTNFIVAATGVIVPPPIVTSPMEGAVIPQSVVVFAGIANVGNTITICVSGNICVSTGVNANGEFYYEYPPLPDGLYTATLLAQDSIGNTSLPVTVVFEIRTN